MFGNPFCWLKLALHCSCTSMQFVGTLIQSNICIKFTSYTTYNSSFTSGKRSADQCCELVKVEESTSWPLDHVSVVSLTSAPFLERVKVLIRLIRSLISVEFSSATMIYRVGSLFSSTCVWAFAACDWSVWSCWPIRYRQVWFCVTTSFSGSFSSKWDNAAFWLVNFEACSLCLQM